MDIEVLSWIFTEELIMKCFNISMQTTDNKVKEAACEFVNQVCGANTDDVSGAEDQCECLVGCITVCFSFSLSSFFLI